MTNSTAPFRPSQVLFVDIDAPLPTITGERGSENRYEQASLFIRLHDEPLGSLNVDIPEGGLDPKKLAETIWRKFAPEVNAHLKTDGLPTVDQLTPSGIDRPSHLPCWAAASDPAKLPFISVVLPTRDRAKELERNLYSILELEGPEFEIVIIDNAAKTDETKRLVEEKFSHDPRVRYFSQTRPGISPARNRGLKEARGEIVAFTDDDVLVDPHWLWAIARAFATHPQIDAVTGLVLPAAFESQAQVWFEEYGGFNKGYKLRLLTKHRQPGDSILYPFTGGSYGSGNNMAVRKSAMEKIGGFDERLGVGSPSKSGEDLDVFIALVMNGGTIAYEPAAIISHFHREDYEGLKYQLKSYGTGLAVLYIKWALRRPLDILRRVPKGLWFLLSPKSGKNAHRSTTFPKELIKVELQGIALGPLAFLKSKIGKTN